MQTRSRPQTQLAIGALVGSAVGDALGAPFEFQPAGRYSARFPQTVLGGVGEMVGGGAWAPGEFTDDTHMALALAESLIARGAVDPEDLWARWRAWAGRAKDVGILTRLALARPSHEGAALHAHEANGGKSAGNGSLMRNTPAVLFSLRSSASAASMPETAVPTADAAVALAVAHSRLTHHARTNEIGVALHARMLHAAIHGDDMFDAADEAIRGLSRDAGIDARERDRWARLLDPRWTPADAEFGNGTVWTCLAQAAWAVRRARDFEEAVRTAVDLGDDADTVGCVAGSLAGARWGVQAIPSRWTTYVHGSMDTPAGRASYDFATLQDLARRLLGQGPASAAPAEELGVATRVHDEAPVHAAELEGAKRAPRDWAVVSLCRTGGAFRGHPVRREVFMIDQYHASANPAIHSALRDAVDAVDAFLAESPERPVLVHCHGGRSRTALVLKAWAMRRHGWSEPEAHAWLVRSWPRAHRGNPVFVELLENRWP